MPAVDLLVPGALDTLTGGYLYDRRIFRELSSLGWQTQAHALDPSFPEPQAPALDRARSTIAAIPDGRLLVIDGLALAGLTPLLEEIADRLRPVALIHHPLADETGIEPDRARRLEAAEKDALALMPQVIVTSAWTRQRLQRYAVDPHRIAVVEPGIDRDEVPARAPSATLRMLCVATLTPRKGHALLIEALARLEHHDWTLRCAGSLDLDKACAARIARQIDGAGLASRIELLGRLEPEQVRREYAGADLFVLPSYLEGYGMALAEAIAHGLPVISTTAGAIPDTVPPKAGRLVPPGDVAALSAALDELMRDRAALERLEGAARSVAGSWRSWTDAAARFAAVLAACPEP